MIGPLGTRNKICKFWDHTKGWTKFDSSKIHKNRSNQLKFSVIVPLGLGNETCKFWNHTRGWTKMGNFFRTQTNHSESVQF